MTFENLLPLLTGPASALGVCLLIGLGVYKLLRDLVVPMMQNAVTRHLDQVDDMMKHHTREHERIMGGLDALNARIEAGVCESPPCKFIEAAK